jgi:hypothetical protein
VKDFVHLVDINGVSHLINMRYVKRGILNRRYTSDPWQLTLTMLGTERIVVELSTEQVNRVLAWCVA